MSGKLQVHASLKDLDIIIAENLAMFAIVEGRNWKLKLIKGWAAEDAPAWMTELREKNGPAWVLDARF
jgi:hypothetical protein